MLKGFSMRFVRDRRMIRFGRRWNTTHVASEVPAAHHDADENGMTALHWEAKKDCPDVVKSLVDTGADIEAKGHWGRSPLLEASKKGNIAMVKMLVKAGASVCATDNDSGTCLTLAAHHGHTETVRYLVGLPEVDVKHADNCGFTALHNAVDRGHVDVVQVLIDAGADIEARCNIARSPLLYACGYKGDFGIVKMLVEAGASVRATDDYRASCFTQAAYFRQTETMRYLVGLKDVDVNHAAERDNTALHTACILGVVNTVQFLIGAGADIEAKNSLGRSPLHLACREREL